MPNFLTGLAGLQLDFSGWLPLWQRSVFRFFSSLLLRFQALQLFFTLLPSLPCLVFCDSSHLLCSFHPHHCSIVGLHLVGLPLLPVASLKCFPFNCHFQHSFLH